MPVPHAITVLQLDTNFPRIPGDIGCAETFASALEILKIPGASVARIVTDHPQDINITPFTFALNRAKGDIITTSCGFLSYWQTTFAAQTAKPFIASALTALPHLARHYSPDELMIVTFDAAKLGPHHLQGCPAFAASIIGLASTDHLRDVILNDRLSLDPELASQQLCTRIALAQTPQTCAILFECTNLPPYKAAVMKSTGLPVFDILTLISANTPTAVAPAFRGPYLP
jgi:hypothetical protein